MDHQTPKTGDLVGGDKIARQVNISGHGTYIGSQTIQYGERKIKRHLTPPPFQPEIFLGRDEDMQAIEHLLFSSQTPLLLLNGDGGVGKTSLAAAYYGFNQAKYQHVAWVLSEKSILRALLGLAPALGIEFQPTSDMAARFSTLLIVLAQLEAPSLLVIDNANDLDDLEENYQNLRRLNNLHILITTRITELAYAKRHRVMGLAKSESLLLFQQYYPKHQAKEDRLFGQVYDAVGGNTLVIELLAKNLHVSNRFRGNYTLAALLSDLQQRGILQLASSNYIQTDYHSHGLLREEKPEPIIAAMYDLGELPNAESELLSIFSVLPAESIQLGFLEDALAKTEDLLTHLVRLSQKGWIEYNEATYSFKCSPIVQEITRHKKGKQLFIDSKPLINELNKKLDYEPGIGHFRNSNYDQASICARYASTLLGTVTDHDYEIGKLCERASNFHQTTGDLHNAMTLAKKLRMIMQDLNKANPSDRSNRYGLAISYSKLGSVCTSLGKLDLALMYFESRLKITEDLVEDDPDDQRAKNSLAVSFQMMGSTHVEMGNWELAWVYFARFSATIHELHVQYPQTTTYKNGLAISCEKLGEIQIALGDFEAALSFFETYSELSKQIYDANPTSKTAKHLLANSFEKLATTNTKLGHSEIALGLLFDYAKLESELFHEDPTNVVFKNELAMAYFKIGLFYKDTLQDAFKSNEYLRQSESLFIELVNDAPTFAAFATALSEIRNHLV